MAAITVLLIDAGQANRNFLAQLLDRIGNFTMVSGIIYKILKMS
jgi:hypothetical protein